MTTEQRRAARTWRPSDPVLSLIRLIYRQPGICRPDW